MRSGSESSARKRLVVASCAAVLMLAAAACEKAMFQPLDGGQGGRGGGAAAGRGGSAGGGASGSGVAGIGGGGEGGTVAGAGGGIGGVGGTAAGAGGRGGAGGSGGVAGAAGSGGMAGGNAGRGGTAGSAMAGMGGGGASGGTGGSAGSGATDGGGSDGPAAVTPTLAGQIVITELMHNAASISDDLGEWFEIYNPSPAVTYDLFGCEARDLNPPGKIIDTHLLLPPLGFKVLAVSATPGFTPDYVYTTVATNPEVKFDNQGADQAQLFCGGVLIDVFAYPLAVAAGDGRAFNLDPDHFNAVDNDSMANWCLSRNSMTGDAYENSGPNYGTPGRANTQCP